MKSGSRRRPAWDAEYLESLMATTAQLPRARYSCFPSTVPRVGPAFPTSRDRFFQDSTAASGSGSVAPATRPHDTATNVEHPINRINSVDSHCLVMAQGQPKRQSPFIDDQYAEISARNHQALLHNQYFYSSGGVFGLAEAEGSNTVVHTPQVLPAGQIQSQVGAQFPPVFSAFGQTMVDTEITTIQYLQTRLADETHFTSIPAMAIQQPAVPSQVIYRRPQPMSDNYMGNRYLLGNYSADHIPDHCNTSLWIFGLPSNITVHQLLKNIRGFGRIFAVHINEPEVEKGHVLAAAKITFFEAVAAQSFLLRYRNSGLPVGNLIASVRLNRVKVEEKGFPKHYSRVIVVIGPRQFTSQGRIHHWLQTHGIYYDIDEILEYINHAAGSVKLEFRFGSFRGQASQAYHVLRGQEARERGIMVFFGEDPCA